jgi:mRNA-degrading endonuclease toxin of MazEF toxin-antitoxin module
MLGFADSPAGRRPALVVSGSLFNKHTGVSHALPNYQHLAEILSVPRRAGALTFT